MGCNEELRDGVSGGLPGLKLSGHLITPRSPSQTSEENEQAWEGPGPAFLSSALSWTPLTHGPMPHTNREQIERKTHWAHWQAEQEGRTGWKEVL